MGRGEGTHQAKGRRGGTPRQRRIRAAQAATRSTSPGRLTSWLQGGTDVASNAWPQGPHWRPCAAGEECKSARGPRHRQAYSTSKSVRFCEACRLHLAQVG